MIQRSRVGRGALLLGVGMALGGQEAPECEASPTPGTGGAVVVINEVMWSPPAGSAGVEWVELWNIGGEVVDLGGLMLTDNEGVDVNEGRFTFSVGTLLAPGAYLTIGGAAGAGVMMSWGAGGPVLSNSGDELSLVRDVDGDGLFVAADVVDGMRYTPGMGGGGDGPSLVRVCSTCDGQLPTSWAESTQWGGTPGADNGGPAVNTPTPPPPPTPTALPVGGRVLFDAGHCQKCGDADWVITGAYSSFAEALRDEGFEVASTTADFSDASLAGYDVLVVPEPQEPLKAAEQQALVNMASSGRGILMIANHIGSDRNGDGWDSVEVWNGYQQGGRTAANDWLATNFRFRFLERQYSQDPLTDVRTHPVTRGVDAVGLYAGTTVEVVDGARVTGVIYPTTTSWGPMVAAVTPGIGGRVVAVGDSSPFSDGTCGCGDDLTDNWNDYDHPALAVSAVRWLAGWD